jgi:hypothetical protein
MPNWCSNTLYITGPESDAKALRTLMTTATSKFDFEAILPMPEELRQSESGTTSQTAWHLKYGDWSKVAWKYGPDQYPTRDVAIEAARAADDWRPCVIGKKNNPFPTIPPRSFDELADAVQSRVMRYGHPDWYEWSCATWGTKWNANDCGWMSPARAVKREAAQVAYFDTAWGPPVPVIVALSERFPSLCLRLSFYEEDGWQGFITLEHGDITAQKDETCNWREESTSLSHDLTRPEDTIYIGHARDSQAGVPAFDKSKWANPFDGGEHTVEQAAGLYLRWVQSDATVEPLLPAGNWHRPTLDEIREELQRRTLLCPCRGSGECHGRVLMRLACGWDGEDEDYTQDERDPPAPWAAGDIEVPVVRYDGPAR